VVGPTVGYLPRKKVGCCGTAFDQKTPTREKDLKCMCLNKGWYKDRGQMVPDPKKACGFMDSSRIKEVGRPKDRRSQTQIFLNIWDAGKEGQKFVLGKVSHRGHLHLGEYFTAGGMRGMPFLLWRISSIPWGRNREDSNGQKRWNENLQMCTPKRGGVSGQLPILRGNSVFRGD